MESMKKLVPWIGIALCIALMARKIWVYGGEWEFSPRGIPVSALSSDGMTYRNGRTIDPVSMFLIQSGIEEQTGAALYGLLFICIAVFAAQMRSVMRTSETIERGKELDAALDSARELEQAGRYEEARNEYKRYERVLDGGMMKRDRLFKRHFDAAMRRIDGASVERRN